MKLEDIIWDVRHILMALSPTTSINDGDIIDKLASYRMVWIKEYWNKHYRILEDWFQYIGEFTSNTWNIKALPTDPVTYIQGGQIEIPKTIKLHNHIHLRLHWVLSGNIIYPENYHQLIMMIQIADPRISRFDHYAESAGKIYTYPKRDFSLYGILQDPAAATVQVQSNIGAYVNHGELEAGVVYIIESGCSITYETTVGQERTFQIGEIFIGTSESDWVDNDEENPAQIRIYSTQTLNTHNYFAEYPLDVQGVQYCMIEMLTKDYQLRMKSVSDVIQDGVDQFKILMSRS